MWITCSKIKNKKWDEKVSIDENFNNMYPNSVMAICTENHSCEEAKKYVEDIIDYRGSNEYFIFIENEIIGEEFRCIFDCDDYSNDINICFMEDVKIIESNVFNHLCIEHLILPESLETIEDGAFKNCSIGKITSYNKKYIVINGSLFYNADDHLELIYAVPNDNKIDLTGDYILPLTVLRPWSICNYYNCYTEIILPESSYQLLEYAIVSNIPCSIHAHGTTKLSKNAITFYFKNDNGAKGDTKLVNLGTNVSEIQNGAIRNASFISIPVDNTIYKSVDGSVYKDDTLICAAARQKLVIPEGITELSDESVNSLLRLKDIYLPSTLTSLNPKAFIQLPKLIHINPSKKCDTVEYRDNLDGYWKTVVEQNIYEYNDPSYN